jgi:hypothetical protein
MTLRQSVKLISKELKCKDSLLMKSKNVVTWLLLRIKNSKKSDWRLRRFLKLNVVKRNMRLS